MATSLPSRAAPSQLTVCLAQEPDTLYLYARSQPGRAHVLAMLYDGPIDAYDHGYVPVLFQALPSLANGGVRVDPVEVEAGTTVVDAVGRVLPLAAGMQLLRADGSLFVFDGQGLVELPQLNVTFHMRAGLTWSDSRPLTADDSVFSFEVAASPDSNDPQATARERIASYRATDATTVVWSGLPGFLDPLYYTRFWIPLPRHQFAGLTPAEIADSNPARRSPLGWGPYVLREWASGERMLLVRNPAYWRANDGLPVTDQIEIRFVGGGAPGSIQALTDGLCDLAPSGPALEHSDADTAGREVLGPVKLFRAEGQILTHLEFNLQPVYDAVGPASAALQDLRVRQGIAACLDRQTINPGVVPPVTYLPAGHPLQADALERVAFDPAHGRELLAQAGWADSDGDGVLDRAGQAFALTMTGSPDVPEALLATIRAQLSDGCGVEVAPRPLTRGELEGDWPDGIIFGRHFDLAVFNWRIGGVPPCGAYTTEQIASEANPAGSNATGYRDEEFDSACRRALATLDPAVAAQAHKEAQRILARDVPMLPLHFNTRWGAARAGVSGYLLDGSSESELWNIEAMWKSH